MIKIFFLTIFLLALCSARLTIPIQQRFVNVDDEPNSSGSPLNVTVRNTRNEFTANVYLGKKYPDESNRFTVLIQTAGDFTWIPIYQCDGCPRYTYYVCRRKRGCDIQDEEGDENATTIYYPEGQVKGFYGHEMIGFTQDLQFKSEIFWVFEAQRYNSTKFNFSSYVEGFFGLGSNQSHIGLLDQAYQQNYIQDKVFALNVDYNVNQSDSSYITGSLTLGYLPEDKVNKLTWISLNSGSKFSWAVPVSNFKIGSKSVDTTSESYANEVSFDSGTQGLILAPSIIKELSSQLEQFKSDQGSYYICNDNHLSEFPNITLKLANMDITINVFTYLDFPNAFQASGKQHCPLAVHESKIGAQVLGNTFLVNNFVAFSKGNQTIGIYQEYKPISLGFYKTFIQTFWPVILGFVALIVLIVVLKKKKADTLKKELGSDSYSTRIGIYNE